MPAPSPVKKIDIEKRILSVIYSASLNLVFVLLTRRHTLQEPGQTEPAADFTDTSAPRPVDAFLPARWNVHL
jgi:hypothetical protein